MLCENPAQGSRSLSRSVLVELRAKVKKWSTSLPAFLRACCCCCCCCSYHIVWTECTFYLYGLIVPYYAAVVPLVVVFYCLNENEWCETKKSTKKISSKHVVLLRCTVQHSTTCTNATHEAKAIVIGISTAMPPSWWDFLIVVICTSTRVLPYKTAK